MSSVWRQQESSLCVFVCRSPKQLVLMCMLVYFVDIKVGTLNRLVWSPNYDFKLDGCVAKMIPLVHCDIGLGVHGARKPTGVLSLCCCCHWCCWETHLYKVCNNNNNKVLRWQSRPVDSPVKAGCHHPPRATNSPFYKWWNQKKRETHFCCFCSLPSNCTGNQWGREESTDAPSVGGPLNGGL